MIIPTLSALGFCLLGLAIVAQVQLNLLPKLQPQASPGPPIHLISKGGRWRRQIFFGTLFVPSAMITWQIMAPEGSVLCGLLVGAPFLYAALLMAGRGWHLPLRERLLWNASVLERKLSRLQDQGAVASAVGGYPLLINYYEAMGISEPRLTVDNLPSNERRIPHYERAHALAEAFSGHCRVAGQVSVSARLTSVTAEKEAARLASILKTLRAEDSAIAAEFLDVDRLTTTNSDPALPGPPAA